MKKLKKKYRQYKKKKKEGQKLKILLAGIKRFFEKVGKEYTRSSTSKEIYVCSRQPIFHFSLSPSILLFNRPQKLYIILIRRKAAISRKIHFLWYTIIEKGKKKKKKDLGFSEKDRFADCTCTRTQAIIHFAKISL